MSFVVTWREPHATDSASILLDGRDHFVWRDHHEEFDTGEEAEEFIAELEAEGARRVKITLVEDVPLLEEGAQ